MHPALCLLLQAGTVPLPQETVVTAPRSLLPATASAADVTTVTAEQLARTGERSLPRMIERAAGAGVWMQETNLGGGAPILRGLLGEKVLILVDGVRLNDAATRLGPNQSLNTIDPAIVERIEIVRGPSSVLYGSDAMGGAVLIWTKRRQPGSANARGEANAPQVWAGAAYDTALSGGSESLAVSGSSERDGWIAIGTLYDWHKLRSGDGDVENTGYGGSALFGSWSHALDPHRTLRLAARVHRDRDVPRTDRLNTGYGQSAPSNAEFSFKQQEQTGVTLSLDDTQSGALADALQARVFLRHYREDRWVRATGSNSRRMEEDDVTGLGLGLDWRRKLGDSHLLTWGLDFDRDDVDSQRFDRNLVTGVETERTPPFAPNAHYWQSGVFVQDEIFSFEPFVVTAGVRWSHFDFSFNEFTGGPGGGPEIDGDFDALTGSLQVMRPLGENLRAVAGISQGFRAPHLDDLARNGQVFGGTELANPDLDPERSWTAELALDWTAQAWSGALAGYFTNVDDMVGRRLIDEGDPGTLGDETYLRENQGRLEILGVEARVRHTFANGESAWGAQAGLAWQEGRQFDGTIDPGTGTAPFDDVPARRIPPLNGFVSLLYEPREAAGHLSWGELRLTAADGQDELNPGDLTDPRMNPRGTAGWARVDLDAGGPLGERTAGSSWSIGVHNVLDRAYRVHGSGIDAPGVGLVIGVSWYF